MRALGILGTAVSLLALVACSSATSAPVSAGDQAPEAVQEVATSPFTGLPQPTPSPVLIVKLDNTRNAQPHAGLKEADIVYLEEVEYGITRIAAVYSSTVPARIGPMRSARITDIDLTAQFGSPAFAFSGVQRKMWPAINASTVVDVSPNKDAANYARDRTRRAPYNLFLDGPAALAFGTGVSLDRDLGWTFAAEAPTGGTVNTGATMRWSEASAEFTYDPATGQYRVRMNGVPARAEEDADGQSASTVIIQNVTQTASAYFDKGGGNTPHAQTIGAGTATVLRDGRSYQVRWSRPTAADGTTFTMADGSPMPFKPGQQWVVLLNKQTPAVLLPKPSPAPSAASRAPAVT
ncbi:MAG: DUF3048 domain-containing protein [Candidatus Nanopelagicales bacterium]|nr:DUF3048 domain-containing protein [Candidatus Nanopelagicales bacterium]